MVAANTYNTRITTGGRLATVESWLRKNAKSGWKFKLKDISDDMSKKTYDIMFNDKADYDLFRNRFPPTGAANQNPEPAPKRETAAVTAAPAPAPAPTPEPEAEPPAIKPDLGAYLKDSASNFVSALAKVFASKPVQATKDDQQDSALPPSFRSSSATSSSPASLPAPAQKP